MSHPCLPTDNLRKIMDVCMQIKQHLIWSFTCSHYFHLSPYFPHHEHPTRVSENFSFITRREFNPFLYESELILFISACGN